ncbi:MAG: acylphosphatase [Ignavibacteriaceae bacterium]|nr:MAG: acylphosphatase [Chlorobiota bacterium]GJQ32574.1 MAG: acylphosphatase [Ignavibacteriaceae bacterium]
MKIRANFLVKGFVQGVGFRWYILREAQEIGVTGFVRNTWSGEVEIVAEGEEWQIEALHEKAKTGPMRSRVTGVKVVKDSAKNEFNKFEIRH